MLRIVTEQHGDTFTIALSGKLSGAWVGVLDRYWHSIVDTVPSARIVALLSDVSFIDAEGERLLERMWSRGAEFVTAGCMNRQVIDRIRRRSSRPDRFDDVEVGPHKES